MFSVNRLAFTAAAIFLFFAAVAGIGAFTQSRRLPKEPSVSSQGESVRQPHKQTVKVIPQIAPAGRAQISRAYGETPLRFEANTGQTDARVKFISRGSGHTLFLANNEAVIRLQTGAHETTTQPGRTKEVGKGETDGSLFTNGQGWAVLRMKLISTNPAPQIIPAEKLPGVSHYLMGRDKSQWRTNVPSFGAVSYKAVWPGIDLVWHGKQGALEHDFVVAPAADPRKIKLAFAGAQAIKVDEQGALAMQTGAGEVRLLKPVAWQEVDGSRRQIGCEYRITRQTSAESQVEFRLGDYDPNKELVIDPVIALATWFGGEDVDEARSIAVDKDGSAYIAGLTASTDFPVVSAIQPAKVAFADAFVLKLSASGQQVVYATYLGGNGTDQVSSVAVDGAGSAHVTGYTSSTDFPVTAGASQTFFKGIADGFVAKLNPTGSALVWSSLLGGNGYDVANDLALDVAGNVVITGRTTSTDLPANGIQTARSGSALYKTVNSGGSWASSGKGPAGTVTYGITVDPTNADVIYAATDLGVFKSTDGGEQWRGTGFNGAAYDVAIDPQNPSTIYVAAGVQWLKSTNGGDTFVAKFVSQIISNAIAIYAVLVDPKTPATIYLGTDRAAVKSTDGGETWSLLSLFPFSAIRVTRLVAVPNNSAIIFAGTDRGVFRSVDAGVNWETVLIGTEIGGASFSDFFPGITALAIDPAQPQTIYAGLNNNGSVYKSTNGGTTWNRSDTGIGGNGQTVRVNSLAIAKSSLIFAATAGGIYRSTDGGANWSLANEGLVNPFTLSLAVDRNDPANVYAGTISGADAFVAKLNAAGTALSWLTYLGGSGNENGAAVATDRDGNVYVTGTTSSSNFPTANPIQNYGGGLSDAFVTKLNPSGLSLIWSTYLGSSGNEIGYDIAVNSAGEVYTVGSSTPLVYGPVDASISKIRADGSALLWSKIFGGGNDDNALGIALDPTGNPIVTGATGSVDFFPLVNANQTKLNTFGGTGGNDAFVVGFDAISAEVFWSTLLGGVGNDIGWGIAIDPRGNIYVAGSTTSTDFPTANATPPAVRRTDAFIVKYAPSADLAVTITDLPDPVMVNSNLTYAVTVANNGADPALGVTLTTTLPSGVNLISVTPGQGTCRGTGTIICDLGNLSFNGSAAVTIVVKPSSTGTITSRASVSSVTNDPNSANNSATQDTVVGNGSSIFGRVATSGGAGVSGVMLTLTGAASATMTTRADGGFQFANLATGGSYTITPLLEGYVFTPESQTVSSLGSDSTLNFTATPCVFSITPTQQSFPATGGAGNVMIACSDQRCPWTARSNAPWITITSAASGKGNTAVSFNVAPAVGARSGTLTVAGQTFTVWQEFYPCSIENGGVQFQTFTVSPFPRGSASGTFTTGDFNADGKLDLAFLLRPSEQQYRVNLALGDGQGGFASPQPVFNGSVNDVFLSINSGDLNGDGKADLFLTGSDPNGNNGRIVVLFNNGSGAFAAPKIFSVPTSPGGATVGDFNNDGKVDLAVTTGNPNPSPVPIPQDANVAVLFGDGAGGFAVPINSPVPIRAQGLGQIKTGDFNGDGKQDVAVLGFIGSLAIMKGDGKGNLTPGTVLVGSPSMGSITLADFNNDRRTDLIFSSGQLFFADNEGNLGAPITIEGVNGNSVVAEDLNGDNRPDAIFANAGLLTVLLNRGNGQFEPPVSYLNAMTGVSGYVPFASVTATDLNRDGRADLIVIGNPSGASWPDEYGVAALITDPSGGLSAPRNYPATVKLPGDTNTSFSINDGKAADFNNDGLTDLAVISNNDRFSILLGNGKGGFGDPVGYRLPSPANQLAVRDFNRDGKPDLAAVTVYPGRVTIFLNDGTGKFLSPKSFATGDLPQLPAIEDFNGDGAPDIVARGTTAGLSLFINDGNANFTEQTKGLAAEFTSARFTSGDFDGDGNADLFVTSNDPNGSECFMQNKKSRLLFGDGKGGFGRTRTINSNVLPGFLLTGDLNGDGRADLVFANPCSTTPSGGIYLMLGTANDGLSAPVLISPTGGIAAINDFNGDGKPDVAIRRGTNLEILTGKGDGTFNQASIVPALGQFGLLAATDFNGDGSTDLALAGSGQIAVVFSRTLCAPAATVTTTSAASYFSFNLAAESIAAAFGVNLATETREATTVPLPTTLAGVSVKIKDSAGVERDASLFFVSPNQINYQVPKGTTPGPALVKVIRDVNVVATGTIRAMPVNPGLFTANVSGQGLAAALALRVKPDGSQVFEPVSRYDAQQNKFVAVPIDLSNASEQVFLILFGTGLRNRSALANVSAKIGSETSAVSFAGEQGNFVGLDQLNLGIPRSLIGRGELDVAVTVDGRAANAVRISIK